MQEDSPMEEDKHLADEKTEQPTTDFPRQQIESLQKNLQETQEKYLRLLAESENTRKRMQKEKQDNSRYAVDKVIVEFLQPLDSFEKALKYAESMSSDVKNWAFGFEMILSQFKQILADHGIVPFESEGKHFDPHKHEAVEVVESSEYPPGTVVHEFVKGYRSGERIVRPARVKVVKEKGVESNLTQSLESESQDESSTL